MIIKLNKDYAKRCFEDGWVERITDENLFIGEFVINMTDNRFPATADVMFTIEKDPLIQGSVLLANIEDIKDSIIISTCDRANINIPMTYKFREYLVDLSRLKIGDIIPIQIKHRIANIAEPKARVDGQLFIPIPVSYIFIPTGDISTNIDLNRLITYAEDVQKILKTYESHKNYEFFIKYMYPYKEDKTKEIDKTKKETIINIARNAVKLNNKKIIKDSRINWIIDPCVLVENISDDSKPPNLDGEAKTFPLQKLMIILLSDYINMVELLINMIKNYNDDMIKANKVIWDMKNII